MKLRSIPAVLSLTALSLSTAAMAGLGSDFVHGSGWLMKSHATASSNTPPLDGRPMEFTLNQFVASSQQGKANVKLTTSPVKLGTFDLRVRFSQDSDMAVVNKRVANQIAATVKANGGDAFAIVSRDCKTIRNFHYSVECNLAISLK